MITINDFLKKFNADIKFDVDEKLENKIRNSNTRIDNIDYITKDHIEMKEGITTHVFSGIVNEGTVDVEYKLYTKGKNVHWLNFPNTNTKNIKVLI